MTQRIWTAVFALILVLGVVLVTAIAQKAKDGSASTPADDQMSRMMTMMEQMQEQMKQMRDDMAHMQGMGPMRGRMDHMMGMMGHMHSEMQKGCRGMASPDRPRPGG
jgi:hypothetical protein